jgi:hypothetical protein
MHPFRSPRRAAGLLTLTYLAVACGTGTTSPASTAAGQDVVVQVTPAAIALAVAGQQAFTASVTGTANTAVAWSIQEASGCGSVSSSGVYTAPGAVATCHVVATSAADGTKKASATVTLTAALPITVAITPSSPTVNECQTVSFTASVTGSTNQSVMWSVQEGAAGGTIGLAGLYTAPASSATYHVVATSLASGTSSATVPVVVTSKVLSVAVTPDSISIPPGGTAQFTATVTTTCGAFTSLQAVGAGGGVTGAN